MRDAVKAHAPTLTGFGVMMVIALFMGSTVYAALPSDGPALAALPSAAIPLPGPGQDADRDSWADDVDLVDGDANVRIEVDGLRSDGTLPYLVVGTQDDQWRLGADAALEWPHIVDLDPLGYDVGSPGWYAANLRTGAWWMSEPAQGASKAIAGTSSLDPDTTIEGVAWPQTFHVAIRDDRPEATLHLSLWDAGPDPDRRMGTWTITMDVPEGTWRIDGVPANGSTWADGARGSIRVAAELAPNIDATTQDAIAARWSPTIHFAEGERFFPLRGDVMPKFHGIANQEPNHRTWTLDFNNGRDAYLLYLADFNGDRRTDHQDAAIMIDLLRQSDLGRPTVYAQVTNATGDQVIVQYWLIYAYNYVEDERGDDVMALAHNGDREFVQLRFASIDDALHGRPIDITYSQHYKGIRFPDPGAGEPPFVNDTHFDIYVAKGSHASYPVPGDDRRLRPTFAGFGDFFDGKGEIWRPGNYTVEILANQEWHQGYQWGPITRHHRELGSSGKPLLKHTFRYPFIDPVLWQQNRLEATADQFTELYGEAP